MVFASEVLRSFLRRKQIATLEELKPMLGTTSTMTVFRKLKNLGYRTSYSHRGKYCTLAEIPQFDEPGLWSCRAVWFSRDGTLLATVQRFVEQAPAGLTASEVQAVLNVEVKQPLLQLYQHKGVDRRVVEGVYVYFSREAGRQREQRLRREARPAVRSTACWMSGSASVCGVGGAQSRLWGRPQDRRVSGTGCAHRGPRTAGVVGGRTGTAANSPSRGGRKPAEKKRRQ